MTAGKTTILYLDEEAACSDVFRRTFGDSRETNTAPAEAFEVLGRVRADIVIADRSLLEMSGADFLREVAELQPPCYRIMLTGA